MTRDSDGGRAQKTVAELLAEHGGQVGGAPRRRRRRAAEDDDAPGGQPKMGDTAPQAIIDRIRAEGPPPDGALRDRRTSDEAEEPGRGRPMPPGGAPAPKRPGPPQSSGGYSVPGADEAGRPPRPPRGSSGRPPSGGAPPQPPRRQQGGAPPPNGAGGPSGAGPNGAGPSGAPRGPGRGGPPSGTRSNLPRSNGVGPNGTSPHGGGPHGPGPRGGGPNGPRPNNAGPNGAGPGGPRGAGPQGTHGAQGELPNRMTATRRVPAPPPPPGGPPGAPREDTLAARLDGLGETAEPETPPEPPHGPPHGPPQGTGGFPMPPRRRRPPRGAPPPPPEPSTEQFPAVEEDPAEQTALADPVDPDEAPAGLAHWDSGRDDDSGPSTGHYVPDFDDDDDEFDGSPARSGMLDDDPLGEAHDADYGDTYDDDDHDDYLYGEELAEADEPRGSRSAVDIDADEADGADEAEDGREEASPAKQWLVLAGQLALGVAGGAGVWLGFNWLWGKLPAAALIAALVVTVGLVWIVRKVRRAEDTQTTVLALLVGLVVTVSPAALLLVSR